MLRLTADTDISSALLGKMYHSKFVIQNVSVNGTVGMMLVLTWFTKMSMANAVMFKYK
jgi:hypothetical protein